MGPVNHIGLYLSRLPCGHPYRLKIMSPVKQKVSDVRTTHTTNIPLISQSWRDLKPKRDETWKKIPQKNIHTMENQDHLSNSCSSLGSIVHMYEDARFSGTMPSTSNQESGNITLPSLPVPNIGAAPTDQQDKVKNLLELTRPLTKLNASLNLMAKEIHEGTYRSCWITKIISPQHLLVGRKRRETASAGRPAN